MKPVRIVSLDVETTGLDPTKHVPLSMGMVDLGTKRDFYREIRWREIRVDPRALAHNQFDFRHYDEYAIEHDVLVGQATTFLRECHGIEAMDVRVLGKNPWFDLEMLKKVFLPTEMVLSMPAGEWPFSYRIVDLNALYVAIAEVTKGHPETIKMGMVKTIHNNVLEAAAQTIDLPDNPTYDKSNGSYGHALLDAWQNVYAWETCLEMGLGLRLD